jgi:tricorn protease
VGKRTWGGLVGFAGNVPLIDGGFVASPRAAVYGLEGEWEVENVGIAPDVEVDLDPKAWREGKDAQLEKALEVVLADLANSPPPAFKRPAYPNYHRGGPVSK